MVNLSGVTPSKNFEDRTGEFQMLVDLKQNLQLSPEEQTMMKKNGWTVKDILILRDMVRKNHYPHRPGVDYPPEG